MVVFYILILCKGRCLDPPIGESKTRFVVLIFRLQTRSLPIESAFEKKGRVNNILSANPLVMNYDSAC